MQPFAAGSAVWFVATLLQDACDVAAQPHGFRLTAAPATWLLVAVATPALLVQTLAEECIFRGWLLRTLLAWSGRPAVAVLVQAALFGAAHIPNGRASAFAACTFGLAAAVLTLRTGSIATSWGVHFANNLAGAVLVASDTDVFAGLPALLTYRGGTDVLDFITDAASLAALVWFFVAGPGRSAQLARSAADAV